MKNLISIIIPIYNTEKYLKRCIDSIVNQTYSNLEIILVDDGSTDLSGSICKKYAKNDSRVTYYYKDNGGLSSARNFGLDRFKGDYVLFVDSDDFIRFDAVETLYFNLIEYNADISTSNTEKGSNDFFSNKGVLPLKKHIFNGFECVDLLYNEEYRNKIVISCNKLYKKEIFKKLRFLEGKIHEDDYIILDILEKCSRLVFIEDTLYYAYSRSDSITRRQYYLKRLDVLDAMENRISYFSNTNNKEYQNYAKIDYLRKSPFHYYNLIKYYKKEVKLQKEIMQKYLRYYNDTKENMSILYIIRYSLFFRMPVVDFLLRRISGKI